MACKYSKTGCSNLLAVANEDGKVEIENTDDRKSADKELHRCCKFCM